MDTLPVIPKPVTESEGVRQPAAPPPAPVKPAPEQDVVFNWSTVEMYSTFAGLYFEHKR
jgi:hypothetical protein